MMTVRKRAFLALVPALVLAGCATGYGPVPGPALAPALAPLPDPLAAGFADPPNEARPRVWWHWMYGNVTQEGIASDLAWMDRAGIGGFQHFDANLATPQVVDQRLIYMQPDWRAAFRFAAAEAARLDMEMAIASSPGWSHTGGPWVVPEDGIKKLVWGETRLAGGQRFAGQINRAPAVTGPYQSVPLADDHSAAAGDDHRVPPQAAGRIAVLAVPLNEPVLPSPAYALLDGRALDAAALTDNATDSGIALPLAPDRSGGVTITYPQPVTVRSLELAIPGLIRPFRQPPVLPVLEARIDGEWRKIADLPLTNTPATHAFAPVTAREFRLLIRNNPDQSTASEPSGPPGAIVVDFFALGDLSTVALNDLRLSGARRVGRAQEKAGFAGVLDYHAIMSGDETPVGLTVDQVLDLTDRVDADGLIDWTPPAGSDWLVLDLGWSLTGKTNHPAPPEATGLEVDKYDPDAVRRYLETYLGLYRETVGDDLFGARGVTALLTDSIEAGYANWTPAMEREFAVRRGYALRPWLPALTGLVIGSEAETERFLYDWRLTLSDLLTDSLYRTTAQVAREHGLTLYGEALEDRRPMLGDDLSMRRYADVPMAALWTWPRGGQVRTTLLGDMKGAASTAHVYGQRLVAAESMTSASSPWAFAPRDLRRIIDLEFAYGINRPVIHTSVHQPRDDLQPGLSLAIFGQYFNRHETWAELARPWVDYMARSAWMLQQGTYFADIALLLGEEAPLTAQFADGQPAGLPTRHGYDLVNAAMLHDGLRVTDDGMLVSQGGTRYRVLALGPDTRSMTLPTLRRLAELVAEGATVVGRKPQATPSLADDAVEFAALADRLWASDRVIDSDDAEAALAGLGMGPDFAFSGGGEGAEILFLHRQLDDQHLYFLTNRQNRPETVEARFRVTGLAPEWWDAVTGTARPLPYRFEGMHTVVPLALGPEDSGFVVFRETASETHREVEAPRQQVLASIEGPWTITFQQGRGAPSSITLDSLVPLDQHADPAVRHFSGIATYTTSFTLPMALSTDLSLDLGQVHDVAEVLVNGRSAGISWWAPDRVAIGHLVQPGENRLEVRVANLWVNRLIGDAQEGAERVTFTTAPTYRPDALLRPSGLAGPVTINLSH